MNRESQIFMIVELSKLVKSGKKRLNPSDADVLVNIAQRLKMGVKLSQEQDEKLLQIFERKTELSRLKW